MTTLHFCTPQKTQSSQPDDQQPVAGEDEPLVSIPVPIQIQTEKSQPKTRKGSRQFISIQSVDESGLPSDTETDMAVDKVRINYP